MKDRILTISCLLVAAGCILAGISISGQWYLLWALSLVPAAWFLLRKRAGILPVSIPLAIYMVTAAAGILLNLPSILMGIGTVAALTAWDLILHNQDSPGGFINPGEVNMNRIHLQALGIASGSGLLLSFLGMTIDMQLPFPVVAGLVLLAAGGLAAVLYQLRKQAG